MFSPRGITSPRVGDRSARDAPEEDEEMNAKENEKYEKKVRKTFKLVQKHGEADSSLKLRDKRWTWMFSDKKYKHDQVYALFLGNPDLNMKDNARIVRIFTSSTFTGEKLHRF